MFQKPNGMPSMIPCMSVKNAEKMIALYEKALGAEVVGMFRCPETGLVMHAVLDFNGSTMFIGEAMPEMACPASAPQSFMIYVEDVDRFVTRAKSNGMMMKEEIEDKFWGDRMGILKDPMGNTWSIGTHMRDVSEEEMLDAVKKMKPKAA